MRILWKTVSKALERPAWGIFTPCPSSTNPVTKKVIRLSSMATPDHLQLLHVTGINGPLQPRRSKGSSPSCCSLDPPWSAVRQGWPLLFSSPQTLLPVVLIVWRLWFCHDISQLLKRLRLHTVRIHELVKLLSSIPSSGLSSQCLGPETEEDTQYFSFFHFLCHQVPCPIHWVWKRQFLNIDHISRAALPSTLTARPLKQISIA